MKISFDQGPRIVGCITTESLLRRSGQELPGDCDILEVRLDLTGLCDGKWMKLCTAIQALGRPVLLTIRDESHGGQWRGREAERLALYLTGLKSVSAVDIEIGARALEVLVPEAHPHGVAVVASFHDFNGTPGLPQLLALESRGRKMGADLVKIATRVNTPAELARLFALPAQATGPICVMGMGASGAISRVALPCAGANWVYGALETPAVPGQLDCRTLAEELDRWGVRPRQ